MTKGQDIIRLFYSLYAKIPFLLRILCLYKQSINLRHVLSIIPSPFLVRRTLWWVISFEITLRGKGTDPSSHKVKKKTY